MTLTESEVHKNKCRNPQINMVPEKMRFQQWLLKLCHTCKLKKFSSIVLSLLYHFWNGCSTNAGSDLIKDKVISSYPMLVWKSHLLRNFNPNIFSGKPERNSSYILEGKSINLVPELHITFRFTPLSFLSWPIRNTMVTYYGNKYS